MSKKKRNAKQEFQNNWYFFMLICRCAPGRVIGQILYHVIDKATWFYMVIVFMEYIFAAVEGKHTFSETVVFIACSLIGIIIADFYLCYYERVIAQVGNQQLYEKLNLLMFQKVNDVELSCYEDAEFYNKYTKTASQTKATALKLIEAVGMMITCIFAIAYSVIRLYYLDKVAILFAVVPLSINRIVQRKINRLRYEHDVANVEAQRKKEYVNRAIYQTEFAKEIRLSNIHNVLFKNLSEAVKELKSNVFKYGTKVTILSVIQGLLTGTILYACYNLYGIARLLVFKNITLSGFVILANLIGYLYYDITLTMGYWGRFAGFSGYIEDLRTFMDYEPKIAQSQKGILPFEEGNKWKVKNVSFRYNAQSPYVLKNINLEINPKEKIAIVGHNGAGKSTLIKVLMRLYDVNEGEILLNDENIKDYKVSAYRDLFGTVFQDYKVLSMSVAENVLMREVKEEDEELVKESLMLAGVHDKIMSLPKGIHTMLTREFDKKGAILSGGEMQKVAIARLFSKDCQLAILDEPSSALDPIAEYRMYESMMKACENKAVIFISHRMSSAVLADKIYMLENGEVIESGTHHELMELKGKYAEMFLMQAEGYKGDADEK